MPGSDLPPNWPYDEVREDLKDLLVECEDALFDTLQEGIKKYPNHEWRSKYTADDHIAHAYAHLQGARAATGCERLQHLQHAHCRIAMALYRDEIIYAQDKS